MKETMTRDVASLREEYLKIWGYQHTIDKERGVVIVQFPGLMFGDFDFGTHQPKRGKALEIISRVSYMAKSSFTDEHGATFKEWTEVNDTNLLFVRTTSLRFSKAWYDPFILKNVLVYEESTGYIGNSSYTALGKLTNTSGTPLCQYNFALVRVNAKTRKAEPFPDWWREKYSRPAEENQPMKMQNLSKPARAERGQVQVLWQDIDANNHVNYQVYLKYVFNIAHLLYARGLVLKGFSNFNTEIAEIDMQFSGEALEGDFLDVYVWDDNREKLYGEVCKNGNTLFQVEVTYFAKTGSVSKL